MEKLVTLQKSEVFEALDRVLKSQDFVRSKRISSFLRFVVEETLAGRGERLKAFTIAQEVFGRDETYDPRTDAIVRVEAGRLRRRLKHYYETEGRDAPVLINIPKGTYTPNFTRNPKVSPQAISDVQESVIRPYRFNRRVILAAGLPILAFLAVIVWVLFNANQPQTTANISAQVQSKTSIVTPFVAVLPLTTLSGDPLEDRLAKGMVEAIINNLAKLSGLSVMAHASMLEIENRPLNIESLRQTYGATHVLRGSLEHSAGIVRVNAQLIDTTTSATIWGNHLDSPVNELFDLQDTIANQITDTLSVEITQDEQLRFLHRHTNEPEALVLYRQGFVLLMPPSDMTRVLTARELFHRATELDPGFAGGYAGKAFSHSVVALFVNSPEPKTELDKGITLAKKAIETDPSFGMGYSTLALAYALSGNTDDGLKNAKTAVVIQPSDAFAHFVLGMNLILSQKAHAAIEPLLVALRLEPAEPRTPYLNVLGIAYFVTGQYSLALDIFDRNDEQGGPTGPHMQVFRAAVYAELGKEKEARAAIDQFLKSDTAFPAEAWLKQWLGTGDSLSRTMSHLYRLGLSKHS